MNENHKVTALVYDRNLKWMDHIPQLISEKPSFIAVGVRHLPCKDGLIDLLRRKGYTVESVK
ncbi:MAG TPA: TraB/GumN family protein [Macellibacteroides fermentans]|nr:TraB/GumN family protein [Macellibacteroides fermentans]